MYKKKTKKTLHDRLNVGLIEAYYPWLHKEEKQEAASLS